MATQESASKVLLVEGVNDKHVVLNLRKRLAPTLTFESLDKDGIDNLLKAIPLEIKAPGRQAVGIVADADNDIRARWQAIADKLSAAGVQPPNTFDAEGTIVQGKPQVGVWLMPDNYHPGELEDFVAKLVPQGHPVWPKAVQYIDGIPPNEAEFSKNKAVRAKLYAWLATLKEPQQMGTAIGTGSLVASPAAESFANWLRRLFSTNP